MPSFRSVLLCSVLLAPAAAALRGQELPYFVTYSHALEEPGNLEVETKSAIARPPDGNRFGATALEFEYGARAWWTSELYLDGQTTAHESTTFTGFRFENRFRPLLREHRINPVLYVEFEDIDGADKALLEVVGHDGAPDLLTPVAESRQERLREAELKLILSSNTHGWNLSENLIFEKNLAHAPWEFGYALGAARPLALHGAAHPGLLSLQEVLVGAELYGGLGDRHHPGLHDTSHYFAPTVSLGLPRGTTLMAAPTFGLNSNSLDHIVRLGVAYEFGQAFERSR